MRETGRFITMIVLSTLIAAFPLAAQESAEPFVFESLRTSYSFNDDGTGTRVEEFRVLLNSDTATQDFGQLLFPYLMGRESVSIDRIAVYDSAGELVHEGAAELRDLPAPVTSQFPFYSDIQIVHATAPPLTRGNVLEVRRSTEILDPEAPGEFWMSPLSRRSSRCAVRS